MAGEGGGNWGEIPNGIIEQDTNQQTADQWAAQQRAQLAQSWADNQRQQLSLQHPDMAQYAAPTPSDSLTQPVPRPDLAAGDSAMPSSPTSSPDGQLPTAPPAANAPVTAPLRSPLNDVSQLGQSGLSYDEALAACGPAAAVRLLSIYGQNIPLSQVVAAAKDVGWTQASGMAGIGSEKALLDHYGIPAVVDTSPDMGKVISDAQSGNPVTISTPNHYFTLSGYDAQSGKFHVGQSGLVFRGGSADMTWDQIRRLGGGISGALFVDSPASPQPGVAALETGKTQQYVPPPTTAGQPQMPDVGAMLQGAGQAVGNAAGAVGGAIQSGLSAVDQATNVPGISPAATMQAVQPLGQAFDQSGAAQAKQENFPSVLDPRKPADPNNPDLSAVGMVGVVGPGEGAGQAAGKALGPLATEVLNNFGGDAEAAIAALRRALQPENLSGGPQDAAASQALAEIAAQRLDTALRKPIASTPQVAPPVTPEAPVVPEMPNSRAQQGPVWQNLPESPAASPRSPAPRPTLLDANPPGSPPPTPPLPPAGPGESAANVPANQRTAAMLQAKPPVIPDDSLVTKLVRWTTNRNVSADRFQEDALRGADLSTTSPPEALDLSSRIRQFATDGTTKVAEDTVLRPAVQSLKSIPDGQNVLSSVLVHQNNVDVASATGNTYRQFPGGGSLIQSQTALNQMQQALGPENWAKVQDSANQVYGLVKDMRQQMLDSGLIDKQTFDAWNGQQPHYIPTRILDYLDKPGGPPVGSKITLSDNGVRHYTAEGTDKFQEDPLGSVLGMIGTVTRNARKNDAVGALLDLDKLGGKPLLKPTTEPVTADGTVVQYLNNGKVERYVAPPQLAAVINGPSIAQAPGIVQKWTAFQRAVTTILSPAFALVRNPSLDVPEYMLRQTARAGGNPLAIPHIVAELGKGYADAFSGLLSGEFKGAGTQAYLKGGGSGSTLVNTFENRSNIVQGLGRGLLGGMTEIKSPGDVARIVKDIVTLKPVAAVAERTELGPRVAAMRLAQQQGAGPLRSTMAGRTVTMDFNEGGTAAKAINQFIPFFNAGIQGSVIPVRMFRENPGGALASSAMMVGLPAVVAEAWNNSDPQRAQDYQDVPQYLKQGGVVIMAPGQAPTDAQGNRKPNFWWINMRGMAPFADIARQAAATGLKAAGNGNAKPEDWSQLLADIGVGVSPIRANTLGDVGNAMTGPGIVPGSGTAAQLAANKDLFRNADIVTKRNDQNAPAVAQAIAGGLTSVAQAIDPKAMIHPSQVDFAVKGLLGGVGSSLEGAGDIGQPPKSAGPQNLPVVGGALRAAGVRNDTGQNFRTAIDERTPADVTAIYRSAGLPADYQPAPVDSTISVGKTKVPLTQAEQVQVQQKTAQRTADSLRAYVNNPGWEKASHETKQSIITREATKAHSAAEREVLATIPQAEIRQRVAAPAGR